MDLSNFKSKSHCVIKLCSLSCCPNVAPPSRDITLWSKQKNSHSVRWQKHLDMIPPLLRNDAEGKPRVIPLIFAIAKCCQNNSGKKLDATLCKLRWYWLWATVCLSTHGQAQLEDSFRWNAALIMLLESTEKLPVQWHQLPLPLFLVSSEDAIRRFLSCFVCK